MADALDLGSSSRKGVGVQVPSPAPFKGECYEWPNAECFIAEV
jgi:hypothetical protein